MANSSPYTLQGSREKEINVSRKMREVVNYLDMLPYVRLRVDYTHVRLFCATVYEHPVVLV